MLYAFPVKFVLSCFLNSFPYSFIHSLANGLTPSFPRVHARLSILAFPPFYVALMNVWSRPLNTTRSHTSPQESWRRELAMRVIFPCSGNGKRRGWESEDGVCNEGLCQSRWGRRWTESGWKVSKLKEGRVTRRYSTLKRIKSIFKSVRKKKLNEKNRV